MKAYFWSDDYAREVTVTDVPAEYAEEAQKRREAMTRSRRACSARSRSGWKAVSWAMSSAWQSRNARPGPWRTAL
jgi:hypothetical protein